jgi:myo-inositol-1(or 4)-monophosphatase
MSNNLNFPVLTGEVCNLAKSVAGYLKHEVARLKYGAVEAKGLNNFVTYVDKTAEERIMSRLDELLPEAGFIAEETKNTRQGERYNWVIDPLDGTTNYIHGIPLYSISIALIDNNKVVMGMVHEVNLNETFYAWKYSPAYLNGKTIRVSKAEKLSDSLLATGFPYYDYSNLNPYLDLFKYLMQNTHGVRRLGSAAVDLAYTACGRFEGFYEYGLNSWDVAAGAFIVQQAGGIVTDFRGDDDFIFGREIIATNQLIHHEFLEVVKSFFQKGKY